ncbi:hypothetical protein X797_008268 [Metarhizium robertsii]|uniref:Uncharacterized protein n=1 Tax=Metarhizium robertsii TaxID=568076 RepID=A0A014P6Z1_9HYPO|nr:hypothetical protein X797_008268 [Metarhizium robertsii]
MKTTLVLGLFTSSILAATVGEGVKPATKDSSALSSVAQNPINIAASTATASTLVAKLRFCDLAGSLCLSKRFVEVRPANAPGTELKD